MDETIDLAKIFRMCQKSQELSNSPKTHVGAVVVGIDMKNNRHFFDGTNVNLSDSFADVHAEQMAVNKCLLDRCYPLAVYATSTSKEEMVALCGSCRHYMNEINRNLQVVIFNPDGSVKLVKMLSELYPLAKDTTTKNENIQMAFLGMTISGKTSPEIK